MRILIAHSYTCLIVWSLPAIAVLPTRMKSSMTATCPEEIREQDR